MKTRTQQIREARERAAQIRAFARQFKQGVQS